MRVCVHRRTELIDVSICSLRSPLTHSFLPFLSFFYSSNTTVIRASQGRRGGSGPDGKVQVLLHSSESGPQADSDPLHSPRAVPLCAVGPRIDGRRQGPRREHTSRQLRDLESDAPAKCLLLLNHSLLLISQSDSTRFAVDLHAMFLNEQSISSWIPTTDSNKYLLCFFYKISLHQHIINYSQNLQTSFACFLISEESSTSYASFLIRLATSWPNTGMLAIGEPFFSFFFFLSFSSLLFLISFGVRTCLSINRVTTSLILSLPSYY